MIVNKIYYEDTMHTHRKHCYSHPNLHNGCEEQINTD